MSGATPVLAIHGVNNRHRRSFEHRVAFFNDRLNEGEGGTRWRLYPVWWGERGSVDTHVGVTVPRPAFREAVDKDRSPTSAEPVDPARLPRDTLDRFLGAVQTELASGAGMRQVDALPAGLEDAIGSSWEHTTVLKFADNDMLDAVGARVAQASTWAQHNGEDLGPAVKQILAEADAGVLEKWAAKLNLASRGLLLEWVSRFFGDVVVYSGDANEPRPPSTPDIPTALDEALADVQRQTEQSPRGKRSRNLRISDLLVPRNRFSRGVASLHWNGNLSRHPTNQAMDQHLESGRPARLRHGTSLRGPKQRRPHSGN
jgi:hypothetical protein